MASVGEAIILLPARLYIVAYIPARFGTRVYIIIYILFLLTSLYYLRLQGQR
jgi:hypothetical protein